MVESSRYQPGPARFRRRSGARCITETAAGASRAAEWDSAKAITSFTGPRVVPRRSRIWPCSVVGTIAPFTRTAISSLDSTTASWSSAVRMGGYYLRSRRIPRCPTIPREPRHDAEGLVVHAYTATPGWLGERLNVACAIDVLHPLALPSQ